MSSVWNKTYEKEKEAGMTEKKKARKPTTAEQKARRNELQRAWRAGVGKEKYRASTKRKRARVKADPKRHAKQLETNRLRRALKQEREKPPVTIRVHKEKSKTKLPSGPLVDLVDRLADERALSIVAVCRSLAISPDTLHGWRTEDVPVDLAVASRVIKRADTSWRAVYAPKRYPQLYLAA